MNEDRDDKDYQIMELKQRISYYEPYKQKYEDLKEDWKYIKSLLDKEFNDNRKHLSIIVDKLNELSDENNILKRRLDYETRMHKRWKDDCLAILEEQDLNDYVKELQKSKKSGWDSEPNTDYITRVKEGLNDE